MFSMWHFECEFPQELVASKGGSRQIWQSFEMTRRPRARCGCHESCVENFQFSGVLCPSPRHLCTTPYIAHTPHALCPRLSRVCIAMFRTYTARLVLVGVFLGEYSFGRFPICSRERRSMAMVVSALFIGVGSVQYCDGTVVQWCSTLGSSSKEGRGCRISSSSGQSCHLPFGWKPEPNPSGCALHCRVQAAASQCTHTPVRWRPWPMIKMASVLLPSTSTELASKKTFLVLWDVYGWCGWRGPCSDNGEGF